MSKVKIMDTYLSTIDKHYVKQENIVKEEEDYCKVCKIEMIVYRSNGVIICPNCGIQKTILLDSEPPPVKYISFGFAPIANAICLLAFSINALADCPN